MIEQSKVNKFDYIGIGLSLLCGIHCLVTPFLIIYLPMLGKSFESPWVHGLMFLIVVLSFHQSIYKHYKIHKSKLALGLGTSGLIILLFTYVNELMHHGHDHAHGEDMGIIILSIIGSVLLISSHIINMKKCRCLKSQGVCTDH